MPSWVGRCVLALALLVLGDCTRAPAPKPPVELPAPAFRDVPVGICEDYPPESTPVRHIERDFRMLSELGVRVLRVSFGWDDLEPEPGRYDWSSSDQLVRLARAHHLALIPYVCYTPIWAVRAPLRDERDAYRSPPRDVRSLERFMAHVTRRYAGDIQSWELWNEPDNRDYWLGTAAEYAELVRAGARGVRRGNPSARVVLGGIAHDLEFLESVLSDASTAALIDVVNVHSYAETWTPGPIEALPEYLDSAARIADRSGERKSLWLAEVGYSSFRRGNFVSDWYTAERAFEHTPRYQASALLRFVTLARAFPRVELIAWYEVSDLPPTRDVIGDPNNRHLGLLDAHGRRKPAFFSFAHAERLFSTALRVIPVTVTASDAADAAHSAVQAYAFQRASGAAFVVAWLAVPKRAPLGRTSARLALPADRTRYAKSARVFDAMGTVRATLTVISSAHRIEIQELELDPGETVVIELT